MSPAQAQDRADDQFMLVLSEQRDRLRQLARGLTVSASDAEDLLQETYLNAWRGWRRQRPSDPAAWFATICRNTASSRHRAQAARPVEVPAEHHLGRIPDPHDTAASALSLIEVEHLAWALSRLPFPQAQALTLMHLQGYTASEVGSLLQCPRGTVLARAHRGRRALAALLHQDQADPHDQT